MCQRSRRLWPSATVHGQRTCCFGWTGGNQDDTLLLRCPTRRPHGAGNVLSCFVIRAKRFREKFEREGVEAFAYMDGASLGLTGVMTNTIRAFAFLRRTSKDIGIAVNTSKMVALPPKGYAPMVNMS